MFNQPTSGMAPWFSSLTSVPRPYWRLTRLQAPFFPLPGAGCGSLSIFASPTQHFSVLNFSISKNADHTTPQARWRAWQTSASLLPGHRRCMANNAAPQPLPKPLPQAALQQKKWSLHSWPQENGGDWNWLSPWMSHHQVLKIHGLYLPNSAWAYFMMSKFLDNL